jgi:hypothetical protein
MVRIILVLTRGGQTWTQAQVPEARAQEKRKGGITFPGNPGNPVLDAFRKRSHGVTACNCFKIVASLCQVRCAVANDGNGMLEKECGLDMLAHAVLIY